MGGGTVQIFLLLCPCSGGYSTVEMVRGGGGPFSFAFFSLLSAFLALSLCGRDLCVTVFVGSFVVFLAVSYFAKC